LELSDINVEGTIETKGGGQRGDDLSNETVQVGVGGSFDIERSAADVIDSFVIEDDGYISVLEKRVGGEHRVVRLDDGGGDLRGRVNGESQLGFLSVVHRQALEKERSETGSCSSTDGVEDEKALETSAVIGEFSDAVEGEVDNFLTNGVVTTGVVIGGIFLTRDQLFRVEQLTVGTGTDFVHGSGLEVQKHGTRDVLASTSLREKGVESIVTATDGLVRGHLAIRLDSVLEAVEFPAGVTDLDTSLSEVERDSFTHIELVGKRWGRWGSER
jgi:hypothetical protein